jgi:NTP pyrophosphatase (non-canonical NTP hydrolase)
MDFDQYQMLAARTANRGIDDDKLNLAISGLGLTGEAGEAAELVKKHLGHGHGLDDEHLAKELGDVLWYVADIARRRGIPLSLVAYKNIQKLEARYPEKFESLLSINRKEGDI